MSYDKLSAIGHTSVSRPSQKSGHLLVHPRNLGKVAYESSLPELSRHVWHLCQNFREVLQKLGKPQKMAKNWPICFAQIYIVQVRNDVTKKFKVSFWPSIPDGQTEIFKKAFEKEKWSSHHSELEQCKFAQSKSANFWPFFVVFLIFWGLSLSFSTSVIHE